MALARFAGKVALISGGTQGIGFETARRLGQEGCKVVISSRKQANVAEAVETLINEGLEVSGIAGNQRLKDDRLKMMKHACDKYGGLDCLFISAGVNPHSGSLLTVTQEQFDRTFDTNLKSNFKFIQESVPIFEKRGGGSIVTNATASAYGAIQSLAGKHLALYSLSKICLVALSQHVNRDCFNKHIRVNCVAPGGVATRFLLESGVNAPNLTQYESLFDAAENENQPALKLAEPREIASVVAFLLSDDASYVSGNCIIPCGGSPFTRAF